MAFVPPFALVAVLLSLDVDAQGLTQDLSGKPQALPPPNAAASPAAVPYQPAGPIVLQPGMLKMPSGVDLPRLKRLDQGEATKVYVEMLRFADGGRAQFPTDMQAQVDLSPSGVTRLFTDTILLSRRFEVFDLRSTVLAKDTNYIVDAQVVEASQLVRQLEGGIRYASTQVTLSVQLKDVSTNALIFPTAVLVDGRTGGTSGDRVTFGARDDPASPGVRRELAADYQKALRRAFQLATLRIESILRPMARVVGTEGGEIALFGGFRHGLQQDDELVLFRAQTARLGEREVLAGTRPIAQVTCSGVGTLTKKVSGYEVQSGDYGVIVEESLLRPRQQ
jgi:hypothetical protein